ncbi:hypothetical protein MKW98_023328 [Papaver atlanticum]|uniref:Uncharacterized protein n=1 Tax=Papaver atlanticum TaxID=357466 RepID=A0AAD4TCH0_9MAGN|nr:hypothetical protein MKW98_023328 [Papaver atlanticum]
MMLVVGLVEFEAALTGKNATSNFISSVCGFENLKPINTEDEGTSEYGLNSAVLASSNEMVLLPMNELVYGTKRSQIFTKPVGDSYCIMQLWCLRTVKRSIVMHDLHLVHTDFET